jgi:hypothetical protein
MTTRNNVRTNCFYRPFCHILFAGGGGKVIQGFPEKEWSESPFVDSIATVGALFLI